MATVLRQRMTGRVVVTVVGDRQVCPLSSSTALPYTSTYQSLHQSLVQLKHYFGIYVFLNHISEYIFFKVQVFPYGAVLTSPYRYVPFSLSTAPFNIIPSHLYWVNKHNKRFNLIELTQTKTIIFGRFLTWGK